MHLCNIRIVYCTGDVHVIYSLYMEQKRDRFKRLATIRTNAVLHRLKVLSNCANRQLYDYDERDIDKIFSEIERKVREAKAKFHYSAKRREEFKL